MDRQTKLDLILKRNIISPPSNTFHIMVEVLKASQQENSCHRRSSKSLLTYRWTEGADIYLYIQFRRKKGTYTQTEHRNSITIWGSRLQKKKGRTNKQTTYSIIYIDNLRNLFWIWISSTCT